MPRLLAAGRQREILQRLDVSDTVTVEALAAAFAVSRETVRRDLKVLAEQGVLTVVHGGALRLDRSEAPFAERRAENREGKAAIATIAASLVSDGMSVLLDSGTTTQAIAEALARADRRRLVVHTTSVANAQALARHASARIHLIGGEFDANDDATCGADARSALRRLKVDLAFVGVGGIDHAGRMTDYTRAAATQRASMLDAAQHGYFVADRSKFGRRLAGPIPGDNRASGLILDCVPPDPLGDILQQRGFAILAPAL